MRIEFVICLSLIGAAIITFIVLRVLNVRPKRPEGLYNYLGYEQPNKSIDFFFPKFKLDSETRRFYTVTGIAFFLGGLFSLAIVLTLMSLFGVTVLT